MEKEVEELRVRLAGLKELSPGEEDTISELAQELDDKEKALYKLQVGYPQQCISFPQSGPTVLDTVVS